MQNLLLDIVKIQPEYCDYLRKFDYRVPYNYDKKRNRPFIGVLFEVNSCMYFAPLSSPKAKHLKISSSIDVLKIDYGKLGIVNFNNMIPVTEENIIRIDLNENPKSLSDLNYQKLLKKQLYWLNRHADKVFCRSDSLYAQYISKTLNGVIAKRCCNFPLLEEKCKEYIRTKSNT